MEAARAVLAAVAALVAYELALCLLRKLRRRRLFAMAERRARERGKKLLVVGDPYNGLASIVTGADYGCGDVCIDLTGCPRCPPGVRIRGRIEDVLPAMDLSRYVVFISCVLEYADDLERVCTELSRVEPGDLFVVNVEPYSLMAYAYPHFLTGEPPPRYVIRECPPRHPRITYAPLSPAAPQ